MKKSEKRSLIFTGLLCLIPLIINICFYGKLPDEVVIHWGVDNTPNGFMDKFYYAFFMPILLLFIHIFTCMLISKGKEKDANKKMHSLVRLIFPIMSNILTVVTIIYNIYYKVDMRIISMCILGALFIVMGNYLPKTKNVKYINLGFSHNLSDKDYKIIARISGFVLIIDGILAFISCLFNEWVSFGLVVLIILEGIGISFYTLKKQVRK
jgi:uncharacterized membrane protein